MKVALLVKIALLAVCWIFTGCSGKNDSRAKDGAKPGEEKLFPYSFDRERLARVSPETCKECHAEVYENWSISDHAHANRLVNIRKDNVAFVPGRTIEQDGSTFKIIKQNEQFMMKVTGPEGKTTEYTFDGVIGYHPLHQYLAPFPGGRLQTTSLAFDPINEQWFDIFDEGRQPGEWGHWTGQGMNWNANCAYCHMTEYHKNFDLATESYKSRWLAQSISCVQCHTGMEQHVADARAGRPYAGGRLTALQRMESCATCHSRRDQLTAEAFKPGDLYADHYALSLPDNPGLYYPDGQIRDEVFVYASFIMSRMGHAGITCADCHETHSGKNLLPIANNALCQKCHSTGLDDAPIIQPELHSRHPAGSTGNLCVECHMPQTTYMGNDPRRDHGFLNPDPLMTRELGIPNACSTCHTDESLDWAIEWSEKWYGEKLAGSPQRERARALHAAYEGLPEAAAQLLALAAKEDIPAWQATYTGLLGNYTYASEVIGYLRNQLNHQNPMVRSRAIGGLSFTADAQLAINKGLSDPVREVRLAAAQASLANNRPLPDGPAQRDWQAYLAFNADRPQDAFIIAQEAVNAGEPQEAMRIAKFAITLDSRNAEVFRRAAIIASAAGDNYAAETFLYEGLALDAQNASLLYALALLRAEQENFTEAAALLEDTVAVEPAFYRAWYNLALAYTKTNRWQDAARALQRAAPGMGNDPNYLATQAIIQRQLSQMPGGDIPPMLRKR